jgi:hypothetical protein
LGVVFRAVPPLLALVHTILSLWLLQRINPASFVPSLVLAHMLFYLLFSEFVLLTVRNSRNDLGKGIATQSSLIYSIASCDIRGFPNNSYSRTVIKDIEKWFKEHAFNDVYVP